MRRLLSPAVLGLPLAACSTAAPAAIPLEVGATGGKAQAPGDRVRTEPSTTPPPDKLAFFDTAYQQQMQGGTNP
jgi:hypothetical protein